MNETITYYNQNAEEYFNKTVNVSSLSAIPLLFLSSSHCAVYVMTPSASAIDTSTISLTSPFGSFQPLSSYNPFYREFYSVLYPNPVNDLVG